MDFGNVERGDRVELNAVIDEYTSLRPGARGTVTLVDSLGTVHVDWDGHGNLGLVAEAGDRWHKVKEESE